VADSLRKTGQVAVTVTEGGRGEFTVLVDDRVVAQKTGDTLPTVEEVRKAVNQAGPQPVGA
jgi:hypothetical protein